MPPYNTTQITLIAFRMQQKNYYYQYVQKEKRKKLRKVDSFVLGPAVINTQTLKVDKQ